MLTNREVILFGINDNAGIDPGLSASTHAILVEDPSWSNEGARMNERPAVRTSHGKLQHVFGGSLMSVTFSAEIKGSGTAGTAPEIGPLLRVCGLDETIVASTSVTYAPVSTGYEDGTLYYYKDGTLRKLMGCVGTYNINLEAGSQGKAEFTITGHTQCNGTATAGTATTITLPSTFSAVDDAYNGQTIEVIHGTGAGQSATITDYVGATKVATVASWSVATPDATSVFKINGTVIDSALVTPSYDSTAPVPFIQAAFTVGSYSAVISSLSFDMGAEVVMPDDCNSPDGYGTVQIVGRDPAGSFDPEAVLVATNGFEADWRNGTTMALDTGTIGSTAGNKWRIQMPAIYYREIGPGDREKLRTYDIGYAAAESTTDDEISIAFT